MSLIIKPSVTNSKLRFSEVFNTESQESFYIMGRVNLQPTILNENDPVVCVFRDGGNVQVLWLDVRNNGGLRLYARDNGGSSHYQEFSDVVVPGETLNFAVGYEKTESENRFVFVVNDTVLTEDLAAGVSLYASDGLTLDLNNYNVDSAASADVSAQTFELYSLYLLSGVTLSLADIAEFCEGGLNPIGNPQTGISSGGQANGVAANFSTVSGGYAGGKSFAIGGTLTHEVIADDTAQGESLAPYIQSAVVFSATTTASQIKTGDELELSIFNNSGEVETVNLLGFGELSISAQTSGTVLVQIPCIPLTGAHGLSVGDALTVELFDGTSTAQVSIAGGFVPADDEFYGVVSEKLGIYKNEPDIEIGGEVFARVNAGSLTLDPETGIVYLDSAATLEITAKNSGEQNWQTPAEIDFAAPPAQVTIAGKIQGNGTSPYASLPVKFQLCDTALNLLEVGQVETTSAGEFTIKTLKLGAGDAYILHLFSADLSLSDTVDGLAE